ncbi:uncharacterized protein LOC122498513 isoform X1 [Leptopilina heterotoma]|uniref:uncharacterized protein LOC122498513 isoform X1 n=1 Tax=Leptopilina heterotoma TaxID=63436 RepID=UPI001CA8B636|nr:uncharacterized protein LOC122498513 isoform X1 [Leptopilina heterotoma]
MKHLFLISVFLIHYCQIFGSLNPQGNFISCPKHMKHFLVSENSTEQYCDCDEIYLYHPKHDFCYDAYRQGPCQNGYYYVLSPNSYVATCQKNPCQIDGIVPFRGKCHFLWESGKPCRSETTFLGINDSYQLECGIKRYMGSWYDLKTSKSCPKDSLLTPSDDEHTNYYCKCKETYIYSAKNHSCYQAYKQGPCPLGSYYVLPTGRKEPRCEVNPCNEDGLVPFKGKCHEIYKSGYPCADNLTHLTVTRKTFQLKCIYQPPVSMGGGGIINAPIKACPPGSRRVVTGCKHIFQ